MDSRMGSDTDRFITKPLERGLTNTELINWLGYAPPNSEVIVINRMVVVRWPVESEQRIAPSIFERNDFELRTFEDGVMASLDPVTTAYPEDGLGRFMDFDEDTNPRNET